MIPEFPEFTDLSIGLKPEYDKFYKQYEPYSDFSFGNLMIWLNQFGDLRLSMLRSNIIIECHNLFEDGKYMLTLLGESSIDETLSDLFDYLRDIGERQELNLVPEVVINNVKDTSAFTTTNERSNSNYILETKKLASLGGSEFDNLRKQARRFEKQYSGRFEVREIDIDSYEGVRQLVNNIHTWDMIYTHNDLGRQESFVINTALANAKELGFKNLSIVVDGCVQAMTLYQLVPQTEYVVCNHMKVNFNYRYISTYMTYALAKNLLAQGVPYMNFEQDLGIPGIREHKIRLKPSRFLNIYSVLPARSS